MKKLIYLIVLALILGLVLTGCLLSNVGQVPSSEQSGISGLIKSDDSILVKNYGTINLSGGSQAGHFMEVWDLFACDMIISFTYDANGLVDNDPGPGSDWAMGDHAWAELGIREVGYGDFNPTFGSEGAGIWLATDFHELWEGGIPVAHNTFAPDPTGAPTQDLDDKLILQKAGGHGEGDYNLPSVPPNPGNNHRVWFDRDGVDEWQDDNPLTVDGGTYNTGGTYYIVITLQATSETEGTAYMTINGLDQGFETNGNWNDMELTPAGMTFTGDMTRMQVFYGLYGYGATHSVAFQDITVQGCGYLPGVDCNLVDIAIEKIPKGDGDGTVTDEEVGPGGWRFNSIGQSFVTFAYTLNTAGDGYNVTAGRSNVGLNSGIINDYPTTLDLPQDSSDGVIIFSGKRGEIILTGDTSNDPPLFKLPGEGEGEVRINLHDPDGDGRFEGCAKSPMLKNFGFVVAEGGDYVQIEYFKAYAEVNEEGLVTFFKWTEVSTFKNTTSSN